MKISSHTVLFTLISPLLFSSSAINARSPDAPGPYHGYLSSPESRVYLCNMKENQDCGAAQYEPQSIEGPKGFPEHGPADGKIASAGIQRFAKLDEYGLTRWKKVDFKPGKVTFNWAITAAHKTNGWEYFITKQDWDPTKPLTRASFELEPFCARYDNGQIPSDKVTMTCDVPNRTGYQVILGVWSIFDTGNAFYQVIDTKFPS